MFFLFLFAQQKCCVLAMLATFQKYLKGKFFVFIYLVLYDFFLNINLNVNFYFTKLEKNNRE